MMPRRPFVLPSAAALLIAGALFAPGAALAGAFLFAGEGNGVDIIAHPSNYTGTGGEVEVTLCVDPASPFAADMEISVRNIASTINALESASPNLISGGANDIPPGQFDFESVALHEVGHCIGLAHPNLGSISGVTNTNSTNTTDGANNSLNENDGVDNIFGSADDIRGDDVNLLWFRRTDNNPFLIGATVDASTYSRDLADLPPGDLFAANADRTVGAQVFDIANSEAVMQQGSGSDEDQRQWGADDVATLRLGMSGVDETQGTADDYTIRAVYAGLTTSCDVVLRFDNAATGFARCSVGGTSVGSGHISITTGTASFNSGPTWYFNPVLFDAGLIFRDGFESGDVSAWDALID
ncbi:MAG: hypothetical protein AAFY88_00540 [Acidobacteriota bacterium]